MTKRCLIICACSERHLLPSDNLAKVLSAAQLAGMEIKILPDLCYIAATEPQVLRRMVEENSDILLAACKIRAIEALFDASEAPQPKAILELRGTPITDEALIEIGLLPSGNAAEFAFPNPSPGWSAWFPVIDRKRCSGCRKCADFCLFGVYSIENDRVTVSSPMKCKNNCPACARLCPQLAIIFPKSDIEPICGTPVKAEHSAKISSEAVDLRRLLESRREQKRRLFRE